MSIHLFQFISTLKPTFKSTQFNQPCLIPLRLRTSWSKTNTDVILLIFHPSRHIFWLQIRGLVTVKLHQKLFCYGFQDQTFHVLSSWFINPNEGWQVDLVVSVISIIIIIIIITCMRRAYCDALESVTFVYHCSTVNQQGREDEMLVWNANDFDHGLA